MPIYEYQCTNCQHAYELIQKMSDDPITLCPQCQKNTATRLVSAAGFQLKGTGWYVTDFKDKGKPKPSEQSKGSETKKSTTETTSTASKKGETSDR
ncbi:MAG: zinc ribbon domain-containing protein [Legionellaceae bacterium]|nr:zinc ribbon domain-containing protein [Legionellaceae bacterium]